MLYRGTSTLIEVTLRGLKENNKATEFYQGLLDQTTEIDILKDETWCNVEHSFGKCALVTCTTLLTCLGYRNLLAWQDTMKFAPKALHVNGYLLQFDTIDWM